MQHPTYRKYQGSIELTVWTDQEHNSIELTRTLQDMVTGLVSEDEFDHYEVEITAHDLYEVPNEDE